MILLGFGPLEVTVCWRSEALCGVKPTTSFVCFISNDHFFSNSAPQMIFACALLSSLALTWLTIKAFGTKGNVVGDTSFGPQKFHSHDVSRIGGVAIIGCIGATLAVLFFTQSPTLVSAAYLLLAAIPAFAAGLAEDLTKRVGVATRLSATMLSSAIALYLLGGVLDHVDLPGIDYLLAFAPVAVIFTIFCVAGIANAINIIDGYNGLSGVVCIMIFAAMGFVANIVGDSLVVWASTAGAGAMLGFLVWNYPRGKIFLGDGGAYFVGYLIGQLSVLLAARNPEVSPWFPLMLVAYPVWETFFSIYRKKFIRKMSPGQPDGLHLHMLLYKRLVRVKMFSKSTKDKIRRNSMTSPYLWGVAALGIIPAVLFWKSSNTLIACAALFGITYGLIYRMIVKFKCPSWLIRRG